MTTNPPTLQGVDIDAVHARRTSQADHFPDAGKMVATTHPTKGAPLGATAKTVLECIKANPGQSTHRVYELLQATANPCPAWEATKKTIQNLRQQGHIENRNPVAPRGGTRLPGEWHATGKAEVVRPSPEQMAEAKAKAARAPRKPAAPYQPREPHNKSKDPGRIIALLQAHTVLTNARIAELLDLKTETARSRICNMVNAGQLSRHFESQHGEPKQTVYRLPSKDAARRYRQTEVEGQDGTRLTTSAVPSTPGNFLGWNTPARADALAANKKLSREGNRLTPYTGIHSQCAGAGQLFMAPSRLQR